MQQVDKLLGIAQSFFASNLLVQSQQNPIVFKQTKQTQCYDTNIPQRLLNKAYDADIVFFVTFGSNNVLASCAPCAFDAQTNRPIFAQITIGSQFSLDESVSNVQYEKNVETLIHEMIHGLGFLNGLFDTYIDSTTGETYQQASYIDADEVLFLQTPRVLEYTQFYFKCPSAYGLQMEDNGGQGTEMSHWERRLFFNEIMTGSNYPGDFIFSIFTFMLLQDSGWYRLQSIVPDKMTFGYQKGCGFLNRGCNAGQFPEFCYSLDDQSCSFGNTGFGSCVEDPLANNCKLVEIYSNFDCRDTTQSQPSMDFSYNSICYKGDFTSQGQTSFTSSCHITNCQSSDTQSIISVENENLYCNENDEQLTQSSLSGSLSCPFDIQEQCLKRNECPGQCNQNGYCVSGICYCQNGYSGKDCLTNCQGYRTQQGQCLSQCPRGTFRNEFNKYCMGCPFGCSSCKTEGSCSVCQYGFKFQNGWCERDFSILLKSENIVLEYRLESNSSLSNSLNDISLHSQMKFIVSFFTLIFVATLLF